MNIVAKTRIVRIGNSQGVRIPKLLLDELNLGEDVELTVEENKIVIRSALPTRYGWEEMFRALAEYDDDILLDGDILETTTWDEEEWEW